MNMACLLLRVKMEVKTTTSRLRRVSCDIHNLYTSFGPLPGIPEIGHVFPSPSRNKAFLSVHPARPGASWGALNSGQRILHLESVCVFQFTSIEIDFSFIQSVVVAQVPQSLHYMSLSAL